MANLLLCIKPALSSIEKAALFQCHYAYQYIYCYHIYYTSKKLFLVILKKLFKPNYNQVKWTNRGVFEFPHMNPLLVQTNSLQTISMYMYMAYNIIPYNFTITLHS